MLSLKQTSRAPGFGAAVAVAKSEISEATQGETPEARLDRLARTAPLKLLAEAQKWYGENVIDYTCTFRKQENIAGYLTPVQGIRAKFRELNQSVYMEWVENANKAKRVIYVEGKWKTREGQPGALCEPAGALAKLIVSSIVMPIHGEEAKTASRRTVDQFGFFDALGLIVKYSLMAKQEGALKLTFVGEGMVGKRPTYVFERILPYTGEGGKYPDRVLVFHLDKETLLPVSCASYADDAKKELLGQYEYTDVRLNVGLTEADFDGKTYGM